MHATQPFPARVLFAVILLAATGCTALRDYVDKGFKVGPDYRRPPAPVAADWIDAADLGEDAAGSDLRCWWAVFEDPTLDALIRNAVGQNLSLREAGFRVLQARAARAIADGNLFAQQQDVFGAMARDGASTSAANMQHLEERWFDQWDAGFNLAWELDFWGRFRRAVEAADADLEASVEAYDQVVVTLLGDVASTYTEIRTLQQRRALARKNCDLQQQTYVLAEARFRGQQVNELDVDQAASMLAQTEALIPQVDLQIRQATNRLCILMGMPPRDLEATLGSGRIPEAPQDVALGIPADILRRRPDVRRAERQVAAQSARVGIATSELYPHIAITGTLGYSAEDLDDLFRGNSLQSGIGPSFQWNILNYGRLLNAIRQQDAYLAELIVAYQSQVLQANGEVEDGLAQFLFSRRQAQSLRKSVTAAEKAVKVAVAQYRGGMVDFNRVALLEQNLVDQQDMLTQAQGACVLGLVEVYRALGGGWEIRLEAQPDTVPIPPGDASPASDPAPSAQPAEPNTPPMPPLPDGPAPAKQ